MKLLSQQPIKKLKIPTQSIVNHISLEFLFCLNIWGFTFEQLSSSFLLLSHFSHCALQVFVNSSNLQIILKFPEDYPDQQAPEEWS